MAKLSLVKASTDVTVYVFIQDSTATDGSGLTGLVYNAAGLTCYYARPLAAAAALTLATQTVTGAHSDGGFVEVDSSNMPGVYRLDLSDAICATGVDSVVVMLQGHADMAPVLLEIQLTDFDLNSAAPDVNVAQWLGTAAATPTVAGVPEVDLTHLVGVAQSATDLKDFADDGYDPTTNKVQGVVLTDTVTTLTGHTPQTGDNFARLGAPAGASVSADIAAIEAQTDDIGVAGAGLTAVPWNADWDAEVESEVDDALVARNLDKLVLASGTADSGSTTTLVDAALTQADADYWKGRLLLFTSGNLAGQCAIITDFNAATDTLTFAPAVTQAVVTHTYVILPGISVWDDVLAEHLATGSTGATLNAIEVDTQDVQSRLPAALVSGRMDSDVGAIQAGAITAAAIAANAVDADALAADAVTEIQSGLATSANQTTILNRLGAFTGSGVNTVLGFFQALMRSDATTPTDLGGTYDDATDSLQAIRDRGDSAWATAVGFSTHAAADVWAVATRLLTAGTNIVLAKGVGVTGFNDPDSATIADAVWDEAKAGHVAAGSMGEEIQSHALTSEVAAVETDTQDIQARLPAALVAGRMDSDATAISGSAAAANNLEASAEVIITGAAIAGTLSTTQMSTDLAEGTSEHFNGRIIIWRSGALLGQATDIQSYDGTTKVLTFTAITEAPSDGDTFVIL